MANPETCLHKILGLYVDEKLRTSFICGSCGTAVKPYEEYPERIYSYDEQHNVWVHDPNRRVESDPEYRSWYKDKDGLTHLYRGDGVWDIEPYRGFYTVDMRREVKPPSLAEEATLEDPYQKEISRSQISSALIKYESYKHSSRRMERP